MQNDPMFELHEIQVQLMKDAAELVNDCETFYHNNDKQCDYETTQKLEKIRNAFESISFGLAMKKTLNQMGLVDIVVPKNNIIV